MTITELVNGFTKTKKDDMKTQRGGYRGKPKPQLPPHLKRVHVNARIQKWMLDQLKAREGGRNRIGRNFEKSRF
ncbi:hypothetical protein JCM12294_44040 [Desulfocicer niacini]